MIKLDVLKDALIVVGTGGALLLGGARAFENTRKVPILEKRVARVEHQMRFVVRGIEKTAKLKYVPPREAEVEEGE